MTPPTSPETADIETIAGRLTEAQIKVLDLLARGGCFYAALREPLDFCKDGIIFSELVGIVVHPAAGRPEDRYRVRNKTVGPMYLMAQPLVNCAHRDSGYRRFNITDAGRAVLSHLRSGDPQ